MDINQFTAAITADTMRMETLLMNPTIPNLVEAGSILDGIATLVNNLFEIVNAMDVAEYFMEYFGQLFTMISETQKKIQYLSNLN